MMLVTLLHLFKMYHLKNQSMKKQLPESNRKHKRSFPLIAGMMLLVLLITQCVYGQKKVTGTVRSSDDNLPLPAANVVEKGTTNGTITDNDGRYELTVQNDESVLVFSYISYVTQEITVGGRSVVDVSLTMSNLGIDEVVVIGYGTQKKASLTGAVAAVDVTKIDKIPGGDISRMLDGQIAGVNISTASGAPGSTPQIMIRGMNSITSTNPLVVIDGIPGDISFVNPADIESINVLKDASAATIYGSRASNGVILISTKRGKEGALKVSFKSYLGVHNASLGDVRMANRDEYNLIHTQALEAGGEGLYPWITDPTLPDSDWAGEYFKTGIENKYDISINGGDNKATYGFSAGYYRNSGTVINTGSENFTSRINTDFKFFNERLKVSPSLSFFRKNVDNMYEPTGGGNAGWSDFMETMMQIPHKAIYDPEAPHGFAQPRPGFPSANPIGVRSIVTDNTQVDYLQSSINADLKLFEGIYYKFSYGSTIREDYNFYRMPAYFFGNQSQLEKTYLSEERGKSNEWVVNNLLTFTREFNIHRIDALLGFSREKHDYRYTGGSNRDMPSDILSALSAGIGDRDSWGNRATNTLQSWFGRVNYEIAEKYLFQASVRYDGSSRFSEKNRYGLFYSASAGWAVHKESFFNVPWISELKPRISYGTLGNQNIGNFQFLDLIYTGSRVLNYPLGSTNILQPIAVGAITINSAAYNIKWEESAIVNIGFDLGLFESRLLFTVDYFDTRTKDMLVVVPRPYSSGFNSFPRTNGGTMENKGWEITSTYRNSIGDLRYNISLNLSHSKNKLTQLGSSGESYIDGYVDYENNPTTKTETGGEVGRFYMYNAIGIFQSVEEVTAHAVQPDAEPGDLIFADTNKDGTLDDDDKVYVGSPMPDFEYGLNLSVGYKAFDLSLFIEGKQGNDMYNGFRMMMFRSAYMYNSLSDLTEAWMPGNTETDIFRNTSQDANYNLRVSDYFLEDASYLRFKNIQLSYTINSEFLRKYQVHGIKIFAGSMNPLTLTKYKGFDPALVNEGVFSRGVDRGFYPLTRSVYFGLNLEF